jgi:hypothetical protein
MQLVPLHHGLSIQASSLNASIAFEKSGDDFTFKVEGQGQFQYPCAAGDSVSLDAVITAGLYKLHSVYPALGSDRLLHPLHPCACIIT